MPSPTIQRFRVSFGRGFRVFPRFSIFPLQRGCASDLRSIADIGFEPPYFSVRSSCSSVAPQLWVQRVRNELQRLGHARPGPIEHIGVDGMNPALL